jgi:hypothetical protein
MRQLTDHIVKGDTAPQLTVTVLDEPGHGGACHQYSIQYEPSETETAQHHNNLICYINFQNGPIKTYGVNGVTEAALLAVLVDRYKAFQAGPFACAENSDVLRYLGEALKWTTQRTRNRIARGVEGTNQK